MLKSLLIIFVLLFYTQIYAGDSAIPCVSAQKIIDEATAQFDQKELKKLLQESKEEWQQVRDTEYITVAPKARKRPPPLPRSELKTSVYEYGEITVLNLSEEEALIHVKGPLAEAPTKAASKGPPPLPTKANTEKTLAANEPTVNHKLNKTKGTPPPLPQTAGRSGPPPLPKASAKNSPPKLPYVFKVNPQAKKLTDAIPDVEVITFVAPDGKVKNIEIPKSLNEKFVMQSEKPLTPEEFAKYTKAYGDKKNIQPMMKNVEGTKVQVKGGLREVYQDQNEVDDLYKAHQEKFLQSHDLKTVTDSSKREYVVTTYANEAFKNSADEIGIAFEVEVHDYQYTHVGHTRVKRVPGESLFDYRSKLSAEELVEFNKQLEEFQERLKYHQKIVGRTVNRQFGGVHNSKGISEESFKAVYSQVNGDPDKFVDVLADKGVLADIDTGRIHYENNGLGRKSDLNNCHVYKIPYKGKMIPKLHCYDI